MGAYLAGKSRRLSSSGLGAFLLEDFTSPATVRGPTARAAAGLVGVFAEHIVAGLVALALAATVFFGLPRAGRLLAQRIAYFEP